MAKAKKFGSFSGVFTPSLLTILGVIMYMRLGWVVGNAGLGLALLIIVLSHVVSFTTGLSISSIATDKRIKAGGIYYILSRSLGLPMGGSIGITLFIATALSISLYLVGFSESLLSLEFIRDLTGLEQDVNGYRIVGSISILILVAIAFISTSLAIKVQYYILAAIVLSLVSIGLGLGLASDSGFAGALDNNGASDISLMVLFAVFFPAVTGFTAGVAMSGDLKNPKKDIPKGTLGSIVVGFVIYIVLAIAFGLLVDPNVLKNDTNFLEKLAIFAPLVFAGIWGATLSSALGGILGGPRILQAISADKLTPVIFAKGYGPSREPRNALILIFLLAEAGILIGELNLIAGIVSMFYLASYGFINLAFFLESWASTDFRPSFKVNKYVGLLGFFAAFGIMFKLDMFSMFAAFILMGLIYFIIKRKQIRTEYGDVWQSVWSTVIRTALHKMDQQKIEERNWQPNIIVFSGGTKKRPHLIGLGKAIIGKHGMLSNFDLVENKHSRVLFQKHKQSLSDNDEKKGVFTRRHTVRDIYEGMDMITRTYGFSGIEPNTVLLGWARGTKEPEKFTELLHTFYDLDMNVLLVDYDKKIGFGKYKNIDVWWEQEGQNGNLALTLSKFLLISEEWSGATVRLLIINNTESARVNIVENARRIIEGMRMQAIIKVINNQGGKQSMYDLMKLYGGDTDLSLVSIPDISGKNHKEFIQSTNDLFDNMGTIVMLKASTQFKELKISGIGGDDQIDFSELLEFPREKMKFSPLGNIKDVLVDQPVKELYAHLLADLESHLGNVIEPSFESSKKPIDAFIHHFSKTKSLLFEISDNSPKQRSEKAHNIINWMLNEMITYFTEKETFDIGIIQSDFNETFAHLEKLIASLPEHLTMTLPTDNSEDSKVVQESTRRKKYGVHFRKLVAHSIYSHFSKHYHRLLYDLLSYNDRVHSFLLHTVDHYNKLISSSLAKGEVIEFETELQKSIGEVYDKCIVKSMEFEAYKKDSIKLFLMDFHNIFVDMISRLNDEFTNNKIPAWSNKRKKQANLEIDQTFNSIGENLIIQEEERKVSLLLLKHALTLKEVEINSINIYHNIYSDKIESPLRLVKDYLEKLLLKIDKAEKITLNIEELIEQFNLSALLGDYNKNWENIEKSLRSYNNVLPETIRIKTRDQLSEGLDEFSLQDFLLWIYIEHTLNTNVLKNLSILNENMVNAVSSNFQSVFDIFNILEFSLNGDDQIGEGIPSGEIRSFIEAKILKVELIIEALKKENNSYIRGLEEQLGNLEDNMSIESLRVEASTEQGFYDSVKPGNIKLYLDEFKTKLDTVIRNNIANFWYNFSDVRSIASVRTASRDEAWQSISKMELLRQNCRPKLGSYNAIPFIYKQLFLKKQHFLSEFWVNREKELDRANKSWERFSNGQQGGILLLGDNMSGKSFFIDQFTKDKLKGHKLISIVPPRGGSVSISKFTKAFSLASGMHSSIDSILKNLPEKSVIVLDDIELWWEKSEEGLKLIYLIKTLLQTYRTKHFFIISTRFKSFNAIHKMVPVSHLFQTVIELGNISARHLEKALLKRHKTSGLDLKVIVKNKAKSPSNADYAYLFSRLYLFSRGNIGAAMNAWIAHIETVSTDEITIKMPTLLERDKLLSLDAELRVYLQLFILHKELDVKKMSRLAMQDTKEVKKNIRKLEDLNLISKISGEVYELDRYMYIYFEDLLNN